MGHNKNRQYDEDELAGVVVLGLYGYHFGTLDGLYGNPDAFCWAFNEATGFNWPQIKILDLLTKLSSQMPLRRYDQEVNHA